MRHNFAYLLIASRAIITNTGLSVAAVPAANSAAGRDVGVVFDFFVVIGYEATERASESGLRHVRDARNLPVRNVRAKKGNVGRARRSDRTIFLRDSFFVFPLNYRRYVGTGRPEASRTSRDRRLRRSDRESSTPIF